MEAANKENDSDECILVDEEIAPTNEPKTPMQPNRTSQKDPASNQVLNSDISRDLIKSAEKIEKNIKTTPRPQSAKKKQEEQEKKEKREREKKEREEQRLKREEEIRRKKEEDKKKQEELRMKKEEEERQRLKKLEDLKQKKEEERLKKEEERKKKEEEKEKLNQERLEKERKRQELINAKLEEKKKQEEEKLKEEEEKRRKAEKIKNQFASYFIKKDTPTGSCPNDKDDQKMYRFMPFQLKENMICAPVCRRNDLIEMTNDQRETFIKNLDDNLNDESNSKTNYLTEIRKNPKLIRKQITTCRRNKKIKLVETNEESNSINFIDETESTKVLIDNRTKYKIKYLHFDPKQYRRPPYYGTWTKKSKLINPRRPFFKDEKIIDYEIDSDDEWEDEADGESIDESDKGDMEEEAQNDEEEDDGFFVPHGHLSDDELDEEERLDPQTKLARETIKSQQWEIERKRSSKVQVPKCYFYIEYWKSTENLEFCRSEIKHLQGLQMVPLVSLPVTILTEAHLQQMQKAANEEAKLNKSMKMNLESSNNASPSSSGKSKSNKTNKNNQANTSLNTSAVSSPVAPSNINNKTTILQFMSKKNPSKSISCHAENTFTLTSVNPDTTESNSTSSKDKNNESVKTCGLVNNSSPARNLENKNKSNNSNTPNAQLKNSAQNQIGSPSTPLSINSSSSGIAEKRALSGNEETHGKRLKLENEHSKPEKKTTSSPSVMSLFKNNGKKSLAPNVSGSPDNSNAKSSPSNNQNKKRASIIKFTQISSPKQENSDAKLKGLEEKTLSNDDICMDTTEHPTTNKQIDKENLKEAFITID